MVKTNNLIKTLAKKYNVSEEEAKKQVEEAINETAEEYGLDRKIAEEIVKKAMLIELTL
ncbi:hypothetical protein J7J62_04000 [bacterium]|nr:hypothetical protein [bacterium]